MSGAAQPTLVQNATLIGYDGLQQILINSAGQISAIQPAAVGAVPSTAIATTAAPVDVAGDIVSLGGVDLQINGALGLSFPELNHTHSDTLAKICRYLWAEGVDAFLPTLVTTSLDNIHRALEVIHNYIQQPSEGASAQILGLHLEGPFLNAAKRGAHPEAHLRPLTVPQIDAVLGDYGSVVKLMTLAPELDPTGTVIPHLRSQGIVVSLGHSLATATEAQAAYGQGATMVTHAFNAMPPLHHREPGLLGAALTAPGVACGLIADGRHICPMMLDLLLRAARGGMSEPSDITQNLFLVSDALSPLGLPDGRYPWDTREIEVTDGTARLTDGTLAGTTRGLLAGAENLVAWGLCIPEEAIALATVAPRQAMGLPTLAVGQQTSLLRWRYDSSRRHLKAQRL
ncbi:MAG: N-acetylglucosamine-6-phosphate deacetylase [Elainellaceae cyanobacterium]